jgi:hypothetical protein
VIALGLAIELVAAGLVVVGLLLGEQRAADVLWPAVVLVLLGLVIVTAGVARARPPRRPVGAGVPPSPSDSKRSP